MKKKKSLMSLLIQIQEYLNEIAILGPDQLGRVKVLQARAKRVVRRVRVDYPDMKMTLLNPEKNNARRGLSSSDLGAPLDDKNKENGE